MRRAFVVVLDACGVGALPDAAEYGDAGANTLGHLGEMVGALELPVLGRLGLGSILSLAGLAPAAEPVLHGRLGAIGPGKDSLSGHWGLMGVALDRLPPVYPGGFPPEVLSIVSEISGRQILCNRPYNGIGAIDDFGEEHLRTGSLILYTSQDSVLQIAAHVDVVPAAELAGVCARVRGALPPRHAVGRVIARPFSGRPGAFERTAERHDLCLAPPRPSYLDLLSEAGVEVHAVGKVAELFSGRGIASQHPGATNDRALLETDRLLDSLAGGLVFTNLVETDQVYGHRHDAAGFAGALREIDARIGTWLAALRPDDLLVLTADHGCDVAADHTDHTREYAPLMAVFAGHGSRRHDGVLADVGASVLEWLVPGRPASGLPGRPFVPRGMPVDA